MSTAETIDNAVLKYLDDSRKYAIAVVGPWGSGKTRYIEQHLKPLLKGKGRKLIRASMFGVEDNDELFSRLFSATLGTGREINGNGAGAKARRSARSAGDLAKGIGANAASKYGVSLAATPRTLFDLAIRKKHVIVFDDVERRGKQLDSGALFGAINDLVESRDLKVILVANSLNDIGDEIQEKLIWSTIPFNPTSKELADDLYQGEGFDGFIANVPTRELIAEAANTVQCSNARSFIRAKPLVKMLAESHTLSDSRRSEDGRKSAFVEIASFAFLTAMGQTPRLPNEATVDTSAADEDWFEHAEEKMMHTHYRKATIVEDYFDLKSSVSQQDVDVSIATFTDLYYPNSEGANRMIKILERLGHITDCTETEAETIVGEFTQAIKTFEYNPCDIRRVVSRGADMRVVLSHVGGPPSTLRPAPLLHQSIADSGDPTFLDSLMPWSDSAPEEIGLKPAAAAEAAKMANDPIIDIDPSAFSEDEK